MRSPLPTTVRGTSRLWFGVLLPLACSGCDMLGEIFYTRGLRLVVLVVVVLAAVGFLVSRGTRR
jgi:hypothetical protein